MFLFLPSDPLPSNAAASTASREVLRGRIALVYGTQGPREWTEALRAGALRIANKLYFRGHALVQVLSDKEVGSTAVRTIIHEASRSRGNHARSSSRGISPIMAHCSGSSSGSSSNGDSCEPELSLTEEDAMQVLKEGFGNEQGNGNETGFPEVRHCKRCCLSLLLSVW